MTGYGMEIMEKGWMIIPVVLFGGGILVSWALGGMGIDMVASRSKQEK